MATLLRGESSSRQIARIGRPAVSCLLLRRRPSHIPDFVVSVIVDSVQRVLGGWFQSDVFQKLHETRKSKFYSSAAPVLVTFAVSVSAANFSRSKRNPFWRYLSTTSASMDNRKWSPTSAAFSAAACQISSSDVRDCSAIADTFPYPVTMLCRSRSFDDDQVAKPSTGNIFGFAAAFFRNWYNAVSHGTSIQVLWSRAAMRCQRVAARSFYMTEMVAA